MTASAYSRLYYPGAEVLYPEAWEQREYGDTMFGGKVEPAESKTWLFFFTRCGIMASGGAFEEASTGAPPLHGEVLCPGSGPLGGGQHEEMFPPYSRWSDGVAYPK